MQGTPDIAFAARRKRARRTALIAGGFAMLVFVLSIVQMLKA